jgi:YggT family protein
MTEMFDALLTILRPVFLGLAAVLALVAALDWMVRTRRINPFSRLARVFRSSVDPLLMPIERVVVRAGGLPQNAPWWALMAVAITGIIVLAFVGFARDQAAMLAASAASGPRGFYRLAVTWMISLLQIAIIVRVVGSWIHFRPGAWYSRWSWRLSEPILRPIRNIIPLFGMVDVSPIVAWLLLIVVETVLLSLW